MGKVLVIGYGNPLRRDDGAGVALAARLVGCWQAQGVASQLLTTVQLTPELAVEIANPDVAAVFFVDARVGTAGAPVQVQPLLATAGTPGLGHQLDATLLLAYARLFAERTPPAWLVSIQGVDFDHGEGLSPVVQSTLEKTPELAEQVLHDVLSRRGLKDPYTNHEGWHQCMNSQSHNS